MVTYLQCIIEEYVTYRKLLFPYVTLKPKHHFLVHYPGLILNFGQLMHMTSNDEKFMALQRPPYLWGLCSVGLFI